MAYRAGINNWRIARLRDLPLSTPHSSLPESASRQGTNVSGTSGSQGDGIIVMADPLSIAASLIAIVTAAIQSSKILHDTVSSFQNHQRHVKQLQEELSALQGVLISLRGLAEKDQSVYEPLKIPLLQCHRACNEFEELMATYTRRSGKARTSFRDWAKLRYMGGGITQFTDMLSGYKSTITIALLDANLRTNSVTLEFMNNYKDMIQTTRLDLEDHLQEIDAKLHSIQQLAELDVRRVLEERDSTEQCLRICSTLLSQVDTMRLLPQFGGQSTTILDGRYLATPLPETKRPHTITLAGLTTCADTIKATMSELETLEQQNRDPALCQTAEVPPDTGCGVVDIERLENERRSKKLCLDICTDAADRTATVHIHSVEDIRAGNHSNQLFVSEENDVYHIKGVSAGDDSFQAVGSWSASTIQSFVEQKKRT